MNVLWMVPGVVLVVLVLLDILITVLHPALESPLSNRLHRLIWRTLRLLPIRSSSGESAVLSWGLPLMVAGLIAVWLTLLIVGFALIVLPWLANPRVFTADEPIQPTLLNALYYSGVTVATLGYGDIRPVAPFFRALSVFQSLCGAVAVSAGVTYVLAVYPALSQQQQVATELDAEAAGHADGLPLVRRYLGSRAGWQRELLERLRQLATTLLAITGSHETHPVLYYAHPRQVQHSFLRVLVTAQGLVGALRYGLSADAHAELVRHPHVLLLEQSLHYTLRRLSASLHIAEVTPLHERDDAEQRRALARTYHDLCNELERIGLVCSRQADQAPPVLVEAAIEHPAGESDQLAVQASAGAPEFLGAADDPALDLIATSAEESFVIFRLETDRYIEAYAAACGYAIDRARADFPATWWTGRGERSSSEGS